MKRQHPILNSLRSLHRSAFFEKVSLFAAMYVVTVSLFWFETGMLSKGLLFGLIAASLKTAIARGHARVFSPECAAAAISQGCDVCAAPTAGSVSVVSDFRSKA
jgi:hypothetical protein